LLLHDDPEESIRLFKQVLDIDPMRLEVNLLIAEAYVVEAEEAADEAAKKTAYQEAIEALDAELAMTPKVADAGLSPDEANNSHVHWLRAEIYEALEMYPEAIEALRSYLAASRWHSDVLPWRIPLAEKKIVKLEQALEVPGAVRAPTRSRSRALRN
jgi:tetratricopeptide (TPR) repeat protein